MDAMVLVMPTLAELTGILSDPSKRPLATLFLAMPLSPPGELVQLHEEVPALLMDLLDLVLFPTLKVINLRAILLVRPGRSLRS